MLTYVYKRIFYISFPYFDFVQSSSVIQSELKVFLRSPSLREYLGFYLIIENLKSALNKCYYNITFFLERLCYTMSKIKKSGPGRYEMLFMIANNYTEEEAKTIIAKTEKLITDFKAKIVYKEYWGKKKLAYPIDHHHYAYYNLCEFEADKQIMLDLNRNLTLSKEILRHQIISVPHLSDEERLKLKEKQEQAYVKSSKDRKGEKADKRVREEKTIKEKDDKADIKKVSEEKEEKKSNKANLKDLDEKLEGIISAKDLV